MHNFALTGLLQDRLEYMIGDTRTQLVLCDDSTQHLINVGNIAESTGLVLLNLDQIGDQVGVVMLLL